VDLEYEIEQEPQLEGLQIISCGTAECTAPLLLHAYGTCDSEGCLDSSPVLSADQPLECFKARCVVVFRDNYPYVAVPPYKIVGDFSDRVRESATFSHELSRFNTTAWQITVQDTALSVTVADPSRYAPYSAYTDNFYLHFALTILLELLAAAAALGFWLRIGRRNLLRGMGYVLLANLISYPVTWVFWPSLARFQPIAIREIGALIALGATLFTGLLALLSREEGKARRNWWILILILLPLSILATLSCSFLVAVGYPLLGGLGSSSGLRPEFAIRGLPSGLTIAFSEAFAISFEALLLYLLARKTLALSAGQATLVSFVTNIFSFLAGLALSNWL
jgi:hypothetical protein